MKLIIVFIHVFVLVYVSVASHHILVLTAANQNRQEEEGALPCSVCSFVLRVSVTSSGRPRQVGLQANRPQAFSTLPDRYPSMQFTSDGETQMWIQHVMLQHRTGGD